jgi:hypothetical protein
VAITERSEPASGWSWARIEIHVGEPFRSSPDGEWDQLVEAYVVPDRIRWVREVDGRPVVGADFAVHAGRVLCIGVQHFGSVGHPVSTTAIRDVALDEVGRAAFVGQAMAEQWGRELTPEEEASNDHSAAFLHVTHQPTSTDERKQVERALRSTRGRPSIPRSELARVAELYSQAERQPVKYVAEVMDLSDSQTTRRVQRARRAGLLPPTTPGRAAR